MFKSGEAPIPGYSLLRMLGRGEYGEVWEVEGPGGTHLAIKFIPLQDKKGQVELRSIQAVKLIRHANLVPIHAIWLLDTSGKVMESDSLGKAIAAATQNRADKTMVVGAPQFDESIAYLVICMSLADGNLQDTLDEALKDGKSGIPVHELLEYTRQAAIGLDFLNSPVHLVDGVKVGIQHRDVKPANLLVMGNTVVVGDFGVATTLKEYDATGTSALGSMAFMAPESFSRKPSQASDQYALAITYYKLRCNLLPYDAHVSISELIAIHNNGKLDFTNVPEQERRVLAKATSPDPKLRFGSCKEFCEALIECHQKTAPDKRSKAPAYAATISAVAIGLMAILLMDPFSWFTTPAPAPVPIPPIVSPKNYVLTITPGVVSGTISVQDGSTNELIKSVALSGTNNVELDGSEQILVQAKSTNPFLGSIDQKYTFEDLAKLNWSVSLPEVSQDEWKAKIDALLESGQFTEASRAYTSGAAFDSSLKSLPAPAIHEMEGTIDRFAIAQNETRFAVSSRKPSGEVSPILYSMESGTLVPNPMPAGKGGNSFVRSLFFVGHDNQLIVIREQAIERWDQESDSVSTLFSSSDDSEGPQQLLGGVVSEDGKWLAVRDSDDTIQVFDLTSETSGRPFAASASLNQQIISLLFNAGTNTLTIVCETFPVYHATIPQNSGDVLFAQALPVTSAAASSIVKDAALAGVDSTIIATTQEVTVCEGDMARTDNKFNLWKKLDSPTLSFLRSAGPTGWFLIGTESDPRAYLWNIRDKEPAMSIGSQELAAISEVRFNSDGSWAAIASSNGALKLIDLRSSAPRMLSFQEFADGRVQHVGFTADGRFLIAVVYHKDSRSSSIYAWDFRKCWLALDAQDTPQ